MALPLHILNSAKGDYPDSITDASILSNSSSSTIEPSTPTPVNRRSLQSTTIKPSISIPEIQVYCSSDSEDEGETDSPDASSIDNGSARSFKGDEQVYTAVSSVPAYFPTHPLPDMQAPFEESMLDAGREEATSNNYREANPEKFSRASRRSLILGQHGQFDNISYNAQWRANKEANKDSSHHPVVKIMSQVIFGVHLLCQAMEQSTPEVANILKGFVQELDGFLRRVNADFDVSAKDVTQLHANLSLPLQHVNVFDQLLNDRKYRTQTLEGNIRIDGIIKRYSKLVADYAIDLTALNETNVQLGAYLARIGDGWTRGSQELVEINAAMCKNTAIWDRNVKALLEKAAILNKVLQNCALCVFEFEKRCAAAARRSMSASRSASRKSSMSQLSTARSASNRANKPLPAVPKAPELALPPPQPVAIQQSPRQPPPSASTITPNAPRMPAASAPPSSRPSMSSSRSTRLARSAGLASRSMVDLRSAGFVGATDDLVKFFRTTAPEPPIVTSPAKPRLERKRSFFDLFRLRGRNGSGGSHGSTLASDPRRPRSAPGPTANSARHIPLDSFINLAPMTPMTPGSISSSFSKPQVRFDSVIGSGRQSRQSRRSASTDTPRSKLRLVFINPFKL